MVEAESFTLLIRAAVPETWVRHCPSTSRKRTPFSSSAVTAGRWMLAEIATVSPGWAASSAAWASATSKSAPSCSGVMDLVAGS